MISEKTGWSKHQIMNDHSFAELSFMIADAPKLIKKKPDPKTFSSDDELAEWFGTTITNQDG